MESSLERGGEWRPQLLEVDSGDHSLTEVESGELNSRKAEIGELISREVERSARGGEGRGMESGELNSGCERCGGRWFKSAGGEGGGILEISQLQIPNSAEIIQSLRRPVRN